MRCGVSLVDQTAAAIRGWIDRVGELPELARVRSHTGTRRTKPNPDLLGPPHPHGRGGNLLLRPLVWFLFALEGRDDELQITHRAREAVDARDDQRLPRVDEVEDGAQFGPSLEGGAVAGLGADHGAARSVKRRQLGIEVLVRGRDPGIADAGG